MSQTSEQLQIAHLTASPFWGGPERQMVGLAGAMPPSCRTTFLCLMEQGKAQPFVDQVREGGHDAICLRSNHPHLLAATREVAGCLRERHADVLLTHGYKAALIGWPAARLAGVPVVMVSRGWTAATARVRLYECLDRLVLRLADRVVCVSEGQAAKVLRAGVARSRVQVIPNSVNMERFEKVDESAGATLRWLLPEPVEHIIIAAGRLSPEKGFERLVDAAAEICRTRRDVGFVVVGDGPQGEALRSQVSRLGVGDRVIFAGFRKDVDALLPHATCLVQSSYTEGMPNVVLEAMAAGIPVVATAVGGTPELVRDGETGLLIPAGDTPALVQGIRRVLEDADRRNDMGAAGRLRVQRHFTFASQAAAYVSLFKQITASKKPLAAGPAGVMARV